MTKQIKDCTTCGHAKDIKKSVGSTGVSFTKYLKTHEPCNRCIFYKVKTEWKPIE